MRRLIVVVAVLVSGFAFANSSPVSAAADPSTITGSYANFNYSLSASTITAAMGDTFTFATTTGNNANSYWSLENGTGSVEMTGGNAPVPCVNSLDCRVQDEMVNPPATGTFTVVAHGTVAVWRCTDTAVPIGACPQNRLTSIGTITISAPAPPPSPTYLVQFGPAGGTCTVNGESTSTSWIVVVDRPWVRMPTADQCRRDGYALEGWRSQLGSDDSDVAPGAWGWSYPQSWNAVWRKLEPSVTVSVEGRGLVFRDFRALSPGNLACGEGFYVGFYGTWEICALRGREDVGGTVTMYAVPVLGREFLGWGGACADTPVTSPCVVTPVDATEVTASFTPDVTLTAEAEGGWILDTSGTGVLCGDDPVQFNFFGTWVNLSDFGDFPIRCSSNHMRGSTVSLMAWAGPNHRFDAWGGACADVPNTQTCSVTLEEAETVTASFSTSTLSISKTGDGTVQEFSLSPRVACGETCSADLTPDSTVVLVAIPAEGYYFVGWGGACEGTAATSPCTLTLDESADVSASFAVGHTVTVAIDPTEGNTGLVWSTSPIGVLCGGPWTLCDVTFPPSVTSVTLAAIGGRDHQFLGWGGSCDGTSATSFCTVRFSDEVTEHEASASYEGRSWVRREYPFVGFVGEVIMDLSDDGTTVLGGSGSVRIWNEATSTWIDRGGVRDWLSYSDWAALSGDGRAVIICRPSRGVLVMVWDPDSASWIARGDPVNPVEIGASCDIDQDGDTLVVCGSEGVRVLRWDAVGSWKQLGADLDASYSLCRLSSDGNSVLVDPAVGLGAQLVYQWNAEENLWKQRGSRFTGNSGTLDFSGDGNIVVIGGRAYRWDDELSDWSTLGDSFEGPFSALSPDGSTLVRSDRVSLEFQVRRIIVRRWDQSTSNWIETGDLPSTDPFEDLVLHVNGDGTRVVTALGVYDWRFASR